MSKIKIIADSASMVTEEERKKHNIDTIHMIVTVDGKEYEDGLTLLPPAFFEMLRNGATPSTAQPRLGDMVTKYEQYGKAYEHILVFVMADGLSGTYGSANSAKEIADTYNVTVINTKTVCGAEKAMILTAAKMAEAGASLADILAHIESMVANTGTYLVPFDLEYLKRGGRISSAAAAIGGMLKIKPVLMFSKEGNTIDKLGVARAEKKAYHMIFDDMMKKGINAEAYDFFIHHADAPELAENLSAIFNTVFEGGHVTIDNLAPTIGSHTGCQCVGIQYVKR